MTSLNVKHYLFDGGANVFFRASLSLLQTSRNLLYTTISDHNLIIFKKTHLIGDHVLLSVKFPECHLSLKESEPSTPRSVSDLNPVFVFCVSHSTGYIPALVQ